MHFATEPGAALLAAQAVDWCLQMMHGLRRRTGNSPQSTLPGKQMAFATVLVLIVAAQKGFAVAEHAQELQASGCALDCMLFPMRMKPQHTVATAAETLFLPTAVPVPRAVRVLGMSVSSLCSLQR